MKRKETNRFSWFWKWFLNNQFVTLLLIILLCLLIVLVFTKVSHVFDPIFQFLGVVGMPILMAGILYYLFNPIVDWFEKREVPRVVSIIMIFVVIVALITWGIVILIPKIQEQTASFIRNWPSYWHVIQKQSNSLMENPLFKQFRGEFSHLTKDMSSTFSAIIKGFSKNTFQSLTNVFGIVVNTVIALVTMPFILFYLLKDGKRLPHYFLRFLPVKMRKPTLDVLSDINKQVSQYIRGQLTVAFAVAVMFIIGLSFIGMDYSFTLGILAGFLNLIPYLGSALAMIPILLLGLVAGPGMLVKCIIVFIIEQTIEGRVISPLVLGSQMNIHPVTVIFILLTAGKMFGVLGVILGIPGYAAIKVIGKYAFNWYQKVSGLYEEPEPEPDTDE